MSINKCLLLGRAGFDAETKTLDNGQVVTKFTLATSRKFKTKEGEEKEATQWHKVVAWGKLGELCGRYVTKGKQLFVEGEIQYREYEKDGQKKYFTEINAQHVQFLSDGKAKTEAATEAPDPFLDDELKPPRPAVKNYAPQTSAKPPNGVDQNEEVSF